MARMRGKILVVDDDPDIREVLSDRLRAMRFDVVVARDGQEALEQARREAPSLILLDLQLPKMDGMEVLRGLRANAVEASVIVITAWGTVERAVQAMREGAYDFIAKPLDPAHLEVVISKALERERLREENRYLSGELRALGPQIVSEGPRMKELLRVAQTAAESNATILLLGESGTGKEVFARAIHQWSPRRDKPFVVVNCVALSEELLTSELFGHEKGAFTGAHQMKRGKLELADGGTAFLDEIGDIKPSVQAKLLRVLQEQEFERVGGTKPIRVDIRFIAATNKDLEQALRDGAFRPDLYYRINVVTLSLPPLRERREDLPLLIGHFTEKHSREIKKPIKGIHPRAMEILLSYHWPGNVRELENALERAVVLCAGPEIGPQDLPIRLTERSDDSPLWDRPYHESVVEFKRRLIRRALDRTNGNQTKAAQALGLQRTYLSRLIRELGVRETQSADPSAP